MFVKEQILKWASSLTPQMSFFVVFFLFFFTCQGGVLSSKEIERLNNLPFELRQEVFSKLDLASILDFSFQGEVAQDLLRSLKFWNVPADVMARYSMTSQSVASNFFATKSERRLQMKLKSLICPSHLHQIVPLNISKLTFFISSSIQWIDVKPHLLILAENLPRGFEMSMSSALIFNKPYLSSSDMVKLRHRFRVKVVFLEEVETPHLLNLSQ